LADAADPSLLYYTLGMKEKRRQENHNDKKEKIYQLQLTLSP
jgi:hypothetical protein